MANLVYASVGFTLVATFLLFSSTDALKCYNCNNSEFCADKNLDLSKATNATCRENTVCVKVTGKVVGEKDSVLTYRGCGTNYPTYCDTMGTKMNTSRHWENGTFDMVTLEDVKCNSCGEDFCNTGNRAGVSAAILLTAAIAKMVSR